MRLLEETNAQIVLTSRDTGRISGLPESDRIELRQIDLLEPETAAKRLADCETVIFAPILTLSAPVAEAMRARKTEARLILYSSNNVGLDQTAEIYRLLKAAEGRIKAIAEPWTIIRPTMIYGTPGDGNLGKLMQLARKFRVLPVIGSGEALQQPVHYDDLADLTLELVLELDWRRQEISAAGPDILSLSDLYREVGKASGRQCLQLFVPVSFLKPIAVLFAKIGLPFPLKPAQLDRIDTDKLPTWPELADWESHVSISDGLADIAAQLDAQSG